MIQLGRKRSREFKLQSGNKQRDSLSPLLFITITDRILKAEENRKHLQIIIGYRHLLAAKIDSLMYADDIFLIADNHSNMYKLVNIWSEEIENLEMEISIRKSAQSVDDFCNKNCIGNGGRIVCCFFKDVLYQIYL